MTGSREEFFKKLNAFSLYDLYDNTHPYMTAEEPLTSGSWNLQLK